jgi:hypothetical protein
MHGLRPVLTIARSGLTARRLSQRMTVLIHVLGVRRQAVSLTRMSENYWFPKKRFGWGWGPPRNVQGWAVLTGWIVLLSTGTRALPGFAKVVFFLGMLALLGLILYFKGEPPGRGNWRIR